LQSGRALPSLGHAALSRPLPASQLMTRRPCQRARNSSTCIQAAKDDRPADSNQTSNSSCPDKLPAAVQGEDWRDFRAKLVASTRAADQGNSVESNGEKWGAWAHEVPNLEQGMLLVAHPHMFTSSQEYFHQAVILIYRHDNYGTAGLLLNRPAQIHVGPQPGEDSEKRGTEFDGLPLYLGGDVGQKNIFFLSPHQLDGAREVMQGVYIDGVDEARQGIRAGRFDRQDFKCIVGYCGWAPGQLDREVKSGVWFTAAASRDVALQHVENGPSLWHQVLDLMGGDYAKLSADVKSLHKKVDS